jgi:c-di-GMP-binding flagellar brake protein YcgR
MFVDRRVARRDRRSSLRVPVTCAVRNQVEGRIHLCLASNISLEGMEVIRVRDAPVAPETPVFLQFELPGRGDLIDARGTVVFDRDGPRVGSMGVRFSALPPEQARLIDEFVRSAADPAA